MSQRQRRRLLQVVSRLHARDADRVRLPAIDRGPTRGLWRGAVEAVDRLDPLPDLRELPPNAVFACEALWVLRRQAATRPLTDAWLVRNLAVASWRPSPTARHPGLPVAGCRSWEDVRNRLLVELEWMPAAQLATWERTLPDPVRRRAAQGLALSGRGGVDSSS